MMSAAFHRIGIAGADRDVPLGSQRLGPLFVRDSRAGQVRRQHPVLEQRLQQDAAHFARPKKRNAFPG